MGDHQISIRAPANFRLCFRHAMSGLEKERAMNRVRRSPVLALVDELMTITSALVTPGVGQNLDRDLGLSSIYSYSNFDKQMLTMHTLMGLGIASRHV